MSPFLPSLVLAIVLESKLGVGARGINESVATPCLMVLGQVEAELPWESGGGPSPPWHPSEL